MTSYTKESKPTTAYTLGSKPGLSDNWSSAFITWADAFATWAQNSATQFTKAVPVTPTYTKESKP